MKEIAAQYRRGVFYPHAEPDKEIAAEYKENQAVIHHTKQPKRWKMCMKVNYSELIILLIILEIIVRQDYM